jgi:hypothetical protein
LIDLGAYLVNATNRALNGTVDKPVQGCSGGTCAYQPQTPGSKTKMAGVSPAKGNVDSSSSQAFSEATAQNSGEMQRYGR